jgi:hypothetical protein
MVSRFRCICLLLFLAAGAQAQRAMTVAEVLSFVRSQIKIGDDHSTAEFLRKIKLTEKLNESTVEDLQGQGAGPQTVRALEKLAEESASLPAPPPPVVVKAPPPIPPPDRAEEAAVLAAVRDYALNYTKSLPNYVCVQTTRRKIIPTGRAFDQGYRSQGDVIQELLTFFDQKESYKVEMINGKSTTSVEHNQLGGTVSSGEFGTMLSHIFDPKTGAQFGWDHWGTLRGQRMYVFHYSVPRSEGYSMLDVESHREYVSAYKGLIYAEHDSKAVMRITMDTVGIPADYPVHEVHITLDYAPTDIAGEKFILPYHYLLTSQVDKATTENQANYRLYRKYGAETTITFGDVSDVPADQLKEQPANSTQQPPPPPQK